jgi:hypothetical protein
LNSFVIEPEFLTLESKRAWKKAIQAEITAAVSGAKGLQGKRQALLDKTIEIQKRYSHPSVGALVRHAGFRAAAFATAGKVNVLVRETPEVPLLADMDFLHRCFLENGKLSIYLHLCDSDTEYMRHEVV